jgi:hypothetical protein
MAVLLRPTPESGVLTLTFAELPPGLNGHDGLLRMHWTARRNLMERWHLLVREALDAANWQPQLLFTPATPCVCLALRIDARSMDWDNFGASLKPVLDGLVKCGVVSDDGPDVIRHLTLYQQKATSGKIHKLQLRLRPLDLNTDQV